MSMITLPLHTALVDRGRSVIRVTVPDHELAVLRRVHGGAEVKVIEQDVDDGEFDVSAEAEFDRLTRTYHRTGTANPVESAFVTGPRELERYGFKSGVERTQRMDEVRAFDERRAARKQKRQKAAA